MVVTQIQKVINLLLFDTVWKKIIWSIVIIAVYFTIWRPIRSLIATTVISPLTEQFQVYDTTKNVYLQQANSLSFYVYLLDEKQTSKEFMFKVMGGIFFLFGSLAILFLSTNPSKIIPVYLLLQAGIIILTVLFLFFGLYIHKVGIYAVDLLGRYGEPLINLGFVVMHSNLKQKLSA